MSVVRVCRPVKKIMYVGAVLCLLILSSMPVSALMDSSVNSALPLADTPLPDSFYTFNPVADASLYSASPNNNFGTALTLETDNSPVKNFLIKFNVTGIGTRQIVKATLRLYDTDPS